MDTQTYTEIPTKELVELCLTCGRDHTNFLSLLTALRARKDAVDAIIWKTRDRFVQAFFDPQSPFHGLLSRQEGETKIAQITAPRYGLITGHIPSEPSCAIFISLKCTAGYWHQIAQDVADYKSDFFGHVVENGAKFLEKMQDVFREETWTNRPQELLPAVTALRKNIKFDDEAEAGLDWVTRALEIKPLCQSPVFMEAACNLIAIWYDSDKLSRGMNKKVGSLLEASAIEAHTNIYPQGRETFYKRYKNTIDPPEDYAYG